jgi:flagellar FliL protein
MASTTVDSPRGGSAEAKAPAGDSADGKPEQPAKAAGGFKAWLPLIVAVVAMPGLAFVTTKFVLIPQLQRSLSGPKPAVAATTGAAGAATEAGAAPAKEGEKAPVTGKTKVTASFTKMLVNVAGTMGTRYLMTSVTLVGNTPDFKSKIDDNRDQLMDLATGTLSSKTISDLEKPGARNVIRAELLTVFNNALGGPVVQEIYITELAIQ